MSSHPLSAFTNYTFDSNCSFFCLIFDLVCAPTGDVLIKGLADWAGVTKVCVVGVGVSIAASGGALGWGGVDDLDGVWSPGSIEESSGWGLLCVIRILTMITTANFKKSVAVIPQARNPTKILKHIKHTIIFCQVKKNIRKQKISLFSSWRLSRILLYHNRV